MSCAFEEEGLWLSILQREQKRNRDEVVETTIQRVGCHEVASEWIKVLEGCEVQTNDYDDREGLQATSVWMDHKIPQIEAVL